MNTFRQSMTVFGLVALTLTTLAASPVHAQGIRRDQLRQAARLDRRATHEASLGHFRAAKRLHTEAARLRSAAHHGY